MQIVVLFLVVSGVIGARSGKSEGWSRVAILAIAIMATGLLFNYRFV